MVPFHLIKFRTIFNISPGSIQTLEEPLSLAFKACALLRFTDIKSFLQLKCEMLLEGSNNLLTTTSFDNKVTPELRLIVMFSMDEAAS
jgi:hypothetical protein